MSAKPSKEEQYRRFARLLHDPTSATFGNALGSLRALFPEKSAGALDKAASRWAKHPVVLAERDALAATQKQAVVALGTSIEDYVQRCMTTEAMLLTRGNKGDAQAAVMYAKLAGTALGFLVQRTKDETPPKPEGTTVEAVTRLLEAAERLKRINAANPLPGQIASIQGIQAPALPAGAPSPAGADEEVHDVTEYEVVSTSHDDPANVGADGTE